MAKNESNDKDDTISGADLARRAEEYVKNPQDIEKFTAEREKREKDAKEKAEAKKAGSQSK